MNWEKGLKKIALITHHRSYNYGAVLQTMASVEYFRDLGFEVVVVDYYPKYLVGFGSYKNTFNDPSIINKSFFKRVLMTAIKTPNFKRIKRKFDKYVDCLLPLTRPCYTMKQLQNELPEVDVYCTGSDQVWNNYYTKEFDDVYFLSFVCNRVPCISFASSFGKDKFTMPEMRYLKERLNKYRYISVREDVGVRICESIGQAAELVLDPTLMVNRDFWNGFVSERKVKENYILVYQLHGDSDISSIVRKMKHQTKIIKITTTRYQSMLGVKNVLLPSLEDFVSLFRGAELVLTDSFHGTVLSILFEKKIGIVMPKRFENRISSFLSLIEAKDFIINNYAEWINIDFKSRYLEINKTLNHLREEKINQFNNALKKV